MIVISSFSPFEKTSYSLFFNRADRLITDIGYDDFSAVAPQKTPRVQGHSTVHFVLSGSGKLFIGDNAFTVGANEGFVLPSGVSICYYPNPSDPWRYVWFGVEGSFAALLNQAGFSETSPIFRPKDTAFVTELLTEMILRVKNDTLSDYLFAQSVFLRLLSALTEQAEITEQDTPQYRAVIGEVISLIEQNYSNPSLSVDMLCRIVHVSHSYLCKIFLRETGFTMRQVITNMRLSEAKKQLIDGKSIRETAEAVGYRDMIHFSKEFKRYTGYAPGAFQKSRDRF